MNFDIRNVAIGTPIDEQPDPEWTNATREFLLDNVDLYLAHPREKIQDTKKRNALILSTLSSSESILLYLSAKNNISVFHFSCTTANFLSKSKKIKFKNLVKDGVLIPDYEFKEKFFI